MHDVVTYMKRNGNNGLFSGWWPIDSGIYDGWTELRYSRVRKQPFPLALHEMERDPVAIIKKKEATERKVIRISRLEFWEAKEEKKAERKVVRKPQLPKKPKKRVRKSPQPSAKELDAAIIEHIKATIMNAEGKWKEVVVEEQYEWCKKNMPRIIPKIFPVDIIKFQMEGK